jgi:hypothetical protein
MFDHVFVDTFADARRRGRVIGSVTSDGVERHGVDAERVVAIDHHALRIRPPLQSGWGRSQLTYAAHHRRDGLMMAALVLNGHNTSQSEALLEPFKTRMTQWWQGHGDRRFGLVRRTLQWVTYPRKRYMIRRIRWWRRLATAPVHDENLAVGWSATSPQGDPAAAGNSFVMHAALGDNGELWVRTGNGLVPVIRGMQNLPFCYVVVLRERGAAYYVGSLPGAHGVGAIPHLRPVAIDTRSDEPLVHPCIHQAALGQIGFRVDTRVYAVQVNDVPALATWYGTAHAADELAGDGLIDAVPAEIGGRWEVVDGKLERGEAGVVSHGERSLAVLRPGASSGLLHALVAVPPEGDGVAGLVWRYRDEHNHCRLELGRDGCRLVLRRDGTPRVLARSAAPGPSGGVLASVQLIDDGDSVVAAVNGVRLFEGPVTVDELRDEDGAGIYASSDGVAVRCFEAHPRRVDFSGLLELPAPWHQTGTTTVVHDDFTGSAGSDLDGQRTSDGTRVWQHRYGKGRIETSGEGAAEVVASIDRPNPGDTAYTVEWDDPGFADVSVVITPPGTASGQAQCSRAGLIFWENGRNFLTITTYLDDAYDGASVAIFSHLNGFEELYDAVWSMVGKKIDWGVPYRLRVVFDGMHLVAYVDDEPVLYRALTDIYPDRKRMRVQRVGLAVNWEWGNDTGSSFRDFVAKGVTR